MKTPEEIEKLAKDNIFTEEGQVGFVVGYNRCLLTNKYTEEDLKKAYIQGAFDSNAMARKLHKEIKSFNSPEEYVEWLNNKK